MSGTITLVYIAARQAPPREFVEMVLCGVLWEV